MFKMILLRCLILFMSYLCLQLNIVYGYNIKVNQARPNSPRVCIIGAGIAGLTSSKYLKDEGINFTVLESTRYIGGTWRYDPRVGKDENGLPLHTSMYMHLRTNLPKPTMELRGFPVPTEMQSFPSWNVYYEYIKAYATHFDLHKHIKFLHYVTSVKRVGNVWKVKHRHILKGEEFEEDYDFVIVGTGHFSKPNMPEIPHEKLFKGTIIHSHDYRVPDVFTNRHVLVVGAGPSGMDIALDVAKYSKTLVHSHHSKVNFRTNFPDHYIRKPDIKEFNETGVIFVDGTYEEIDDVIYCTGYEYDYPFLDKSCGLAIDKHSVIPLHKYMVNINEPSMVVMGLVIRACLVVAIDAQARYATALIKGNFTLPSKEEMMSEWQKQADIIRSKGRPISDIHFLAEKEDQYYEEMSEESGIDRVPPVMFKIRTMDTEAKLENLYTYRNYVYEVLDRNTFTRRLESEMKPANNSALP
ncbi:PREDICTED: senecionine N-oxygenase-like isoform X1 [Papilio xuthus]|uniref:Flavin-containing monooxygenase n=1 Tax=Papilio xuthus TaxID=66420 RepID=A0AAJ7EBM9_PAPXU|nr:PREDICTED: senecionine N-oxygenase-like isoform X1 [Papilio xuthus]